MLLFLFLLKILLCVPEITKKILNVSLSLHALLNKINKSNRVPELTHPPAWCRNREGELEGEIYLKSIRAFKSHCRDKSGVHKQTRWDGGNDPANLHKSKWLPFPRQCGQQTWSCLLAPGFLSRPTRPLLITELPTVFLQATPAAAVDQLDSATESNSIYDPCLMYDLPLKEPLTRATLKEYQ